MCIVNILNLKSNLKELWKNWIKFLKSMKTVCKRVEYKSITLRKRKRICKKKLFSCKVLK